MPGGSVWPMRGHPQVTEARESGGAEGEDRREGPRALTSRLRSHGPGTQSQAFWLSSLFRVVIQLVLFCDSTKCAAMFSFYNWACVYCSTFFR